jgi:hypothetical protein
MSEFVGRTGSKRVYSYPLPRFNGLVGPFARNSAAGPATDTPIATSGSVGVTGGTEIPWAVVAVPGVDVHDVPITPVSTGRVRVIGVVAVSNSANAPVNVLVQVEVNGVRSALPLKVEATVINHAADSIGIGGASAIPIEIEIPTVLTLGVTANIRVVVTAQSSPALTLIQDSSTLDVQEVSVATG